MFGFSAKLRRALLPALLGLACWQARAQYIIGADCGVPEASAGYGDGVQGERATEAGSRHSA